MTENARYVIFSVTEKVIWSQEEGMPVAFTEEQQAEIRKKLYDAAKKMVIDTPYYAIKVEELTKAAGISISFIRQRNCFFMKFCVLFMRNCFPLQWKISRLHRIRAQRRTCAGRCLTVMTAYIPAVTGGSG